MWRSQLSDDDYNYVCGKVASTTDERNRVHDIAICNLVEMCMGMAAESTIPKHLRWVAS
jgi:hypothetical protein